MRRYLRISKGQPVKEWVTQACELNKYLREFPKSNRNALEKLDEAEMMDILEFGVPSVWRQQFTIHVFDPVEEGQKKFVDFCTRLETWECQAPKKGQVNPEDRKVTFAEKTPNKKKHAKAFATAKSKDKFY